MKYIKYVLFVNWIFLYRRSSVHFSEAGKLRSEVTDSKEKTKKHEMLK